LERTEGKRRAVEDDIATALLIGEDLGHLALALEQAGAYISKRRLSFAGYRSEWQQRRAEVLAWNEPRLTQYPVSLAITWLTSFEQLSEEARTLLRRLAWLSPAPIPENLLDVPIAGEAENPGGFFDGLVELEGLSLLNRSGEAPQFTVHRLVQEVTRLRQELAQEPHELAAALAWIDAAFVDNPQDVRSWPLLEPLEPHAKAVASFADRAGIGGATAGLLSQLGTLLLTKADYDEAEPLLRRALQIDEASYGQDYPAVARDLNNLAALLQATNRLSEAEPMYRRALQIDEASYGKDHSDVARDLSNLAGLLQATNRLAEAESMYRRALQIDEAKYEQDHPDVARDLSNLAGLLQATNRLAEAEPLIRRGLAIEESTNGKDHINVAILLNNLAVLLRSTNRLAEAEPIYRRGLWILIGLMHQGYQHPNLKAGIVNYISFLQALGLSEEAIQAKIASLSQQE
jgi:tetratricopeptide (TPR) repeat protein